jgi:hypothetical protein
VGALQNRCSRRANARIAWLQAATYASTMILAFVISVCQVMRVTVTTLYVSMLIMPLSSSALYHFVMCARWMIMVFVRNAKEGSS